MKTAHQFARELLAGPDLPIYHFDPSTAGYDDEADTSISDPVVERVEMEWDPPLEGEPQPAFLTIVGNQHADHGIPEGY